MKLSKNAIAVLKNFADINGSILFKPGKLVSTVSNSGAVLVNAELEDDLPQEFGIYDLSAFLNTLSMFDEPELEFNQVDKQGNQYVRIFENRSSCRYYFADPEVIVAPPVDKLDITNKVLEFNLSAEDLKKLQKVSTIMRLEDVTISSIDGKIVITVLDTRNKLNNTFSIEAGDAPEGKEFKFIFRLENLKLLAGNYTVKVEYSDRQFAEFYNEDMKLTYWVAVENGSEYK